MELITAKPGAKQLVCIKLPAPDFDHPTEWMKDYNVVWSQLGCDQ